MGNSGFRKGWDRSTGKVRGTSTGVEERVARSVVEWDVLGAQTFKV